MKLIFRNNIPFSLVDTEAFRDFVGYLDPRLIFKSATTFSRYNLPLWYENVKAAVECILIEELPQCSGIAISIDIWTSRNNDPYQSMPLHYINKSWQLMQFVLNAQYFTGKQLKLTL